MTVPKVDPGHEGASCSVGRTSAGGAYKGPGRRYRDARDHRAYDGQPAPRVHVNGGLETCPSHRERSKTGRLSSSAGTAAKPYIRGRDTVARDDHGTGQRKLALVAVARASGMRAARHHLTSAPCAGPASHHRRPPGHDG